MSDSPETHLARVIYETALPLGAPRFDQLTAPEQERWQMKAWAAMDELVEWGPHREH